LPSREDPPSTTVLQAAVTAGDRKLEAIATLLRRHFEHRERILVVGCGDGSEAAQLSTLLGGHIVGIDIADGFHPDARSRIELVVADARKLPFPDGSFDLVFSFHALEHIPSPRAAVAEMRRVVDLSGGVWLGTPNRSRLVGYLGSRDASGYDKVRWNVVEWRARLAGRFRNELGTHAGFTQDELGALLAAEFSIVRDDTSAYFAILYPRLHRALSLAERARVARFIYPSVYMYARP
jgi:SAM-dependent methyltransferase